MYFLIGVLFSTHAQDNKFSHQDSLRGMLTPERVWWDLINYDLSVFVQPADSSLRGTNRITYRVLQKAERMQIDLQQPMRITGVFQDDKPLKIVTDGNAHFVIFKKKQEIGALENITIQFEGKPKSAVNPPWDGGWVWKKNSDGKWFIATACQGIGASSWWPCKDHPSDEPDSMQIHIAIPSVLKLSAISNGKRILHEQSVENQLAKKKELVDIFHWKVTNPINNYGVNINIGDYVNFGEKFPGEKGVLDCQYYVLSPHLDQAKGQFKQVPMMLKAFENWFGPYPFYEDGYKLVEVPYLGMEHQSSVTYGNEFRNGYLQTDLSNSGWGFNFDFIIIHESGHEWFANSITNQDVADMWIHESFTCYSESLYLNYFFGQQAANEYVQGLRGRIKNDIPIIGEYNVNAEGSGDMYYKGANMLHTLRQWVNDDEKWKLILRKLNQTYYHQTVTSHQIEAFLAQETGFNLTSFFEQYLRTTKVPVFEYSVDKNDFNYRWSQVVNQFEMPIEVQIDGENYWIQPSNEWRTATLKSPIQQVEVNPNYYVEIKK